MEGTDAMLRRAAALVNGRRLSLIKAARRREHLLLAGDTLFAGGVGRTDFPGGNTGKLLASIHDRLLTLPDETLVVPGHGPMTTIGAERQTNPFLV